MEILNVDELATYLKIKPVTIYKNARKGLLPGFKVGGAWRFRKETIDQWILEQENTTGTGGEEEGRAPGNAEGSWPLPCSLCGQSMESSLDVAGECEAEDCSEPVCRRCWNVIGRRRCVKHSDMSSSLHGPSSAESPPLGAIDVGTGKRLETLFLERFESITKRIQVVTSIDGETEVSVRSLLGKRYEDDQCAGILRHPNCRVDPKELRSVFPLNRGVGFTTKKRAVRQLLDEACEVLIEARFWIRPENLLEKGFDVDPISGPELLSAMGGVIEHSKRDGILRIVGWFSPMGWSKEAEALVRNSIDNNTSAIVTPYARFLLVGPEIQDLTFNPNERRTSVFAPLFAGELPEESKARCVSAVRDRIVGVRHITASEITESLGFAERTVKEAMSELASGEDFELREITDVGLTLLRRN